ncbi:hypothetical protein WJX82_002984, partial [Trebouxia sp. C0006]
PLYAIHHLYAASTGPARYQCTMAHDVCINPSVFCTCGCP